MTLKQLQWVLFVLIAVGTPVVTFGFGLSGQQGIVAFFAGIIASLFVFCYVPYLPKYYLSELLIISFAFGLSMTLLVNTRAMDKEWVMAAIFVGMIIPFLTYGILEKRRPESERIGFAVVENPQVERTEVEQTPEQRVKSARNRLIFYIIWFFCALLAQIFNGLKVTLWTVNLLFCILSLVSCWGAYRTAKSVLNNEDSDA